MNKVSIIMPLYNNKKFVEKAIKSVIKQTYENWELIIVNDKSTDGVDKILNKYKDHDKIKIIHNEKNVGCYVSLNKGIQESTGIYIARLDSDDYMKAYKIKVQTEILDAKSNVNMVFCRCKSNGRIICRSMASVLMRKDVIDKIGYYDSVRIAADTEFKERYFKVFDKNTIHRINTVMYFIRDRPDSLSRHAKTGMYSTVRLQYKNYYQKWHRGKKDLYIEFPLIKRKFPVPKDILPEKN